MARALSLFFFVIAVLVASIAAAQKLHNVWAFGNGAGINFNTTPASLIDITGTDGAAAPYYTSSVCNKNGELLFYTDGFKTWNSAHEIIPKYLYRWPWSGFVMPLVCPDPSNDSLYYLFGVSKGSYANRLQYVTINMKTPEGAIVYPQPSTISNYYTVLLPEASVALAGATHCNGQDTWIITYANGAFQSFLLTKAGVAAVPVVSPVPSSVISSPQLQLGYSNLKLAANSEKMIVPLTDRNKIVVLDFDHLTGKFSNPVALTIPNEHQLEDAEISPDGSKLYIATYEVVNPRSNYEIHLVYQMDLNAGTPAQIEKTLLPLNGFGDAVNCSPRRCIALKRTMQLGPDGKIYVSMQDNEETLSTIEQPNKKGAEAYYRENALDLKRTYGLINYNYIRSVSFNLQQNGIQVQNKTCADRPVSFSLLFSRVDSVKWDFGDPSSGSLNSSTALTPQHAYPAPGTYIAKAVIYNKCMADTAITKVVVQADKAVKVPDVIKDTTICVGSALNLNASVPNATNYKWENGLIYPNRVIDKPGQYEIRVANECSSDRRGFIVAYEKCECNIFMPTAFTPNNDGNNDVFKPVVKCGAQAYAFAIYNRYGGVVFETNDIGKGWNGKVNNKEATTGVYIWMLKYKNPNDGSWVNKNGTVTLVR